MVTKSGNFGLSKFITKPAFAGPLIDTRGSLILHTDIVVMVGSCVWLQTFNGTVTLVIRGERSPKPARFESFHH